MFYAWVLVIAMGQNFSMTVPGISSQQECERLFSAMYSAAWITPGHACFRYQVAK